ncbi:MAG TPA: hypothetical protein ENJ45_01485, partial [Phaeodactylibacter sp.]|nr:hypothetical protein [Phaeodactylibacter sp.]
MDKDYFDKKMREILNTPPELEVDADALEGMRRRLKALHVAPVKNSFWAYLWLLFIIPMLFGGGFFLYEYNDLLTKYETLEQKLEDRIDSLQNDEKPFIQYPEKYITYIDTIYRIDTIYQVVYHKNQKNSSGNTLAHFPSFYSSPSKDFLSLTKKARTYSLSNASEQFRALGYKNPLGYKNFADKYSQRFAFDSPFIQEPLLSLFSTTSNDTYIHEAVFLNTITDSLSYSPALLSYDDYLREVPLPKEKSSYLFIPKGVNLAIDYTPKLFIQNKPGGSANRFGLYSRILFSGNQSLEIGLEFLQYQFETVDIDFINTLPLIIPPDNSSDPLHEVYGNLAYLQIPISLRHTFPSYKKFQSFLGVGIVGQKFIQNDLIFEYIRGTEEYQKGYIGTREGLSFNNYKLDLGLQYSLSKKLQTLLHLQYQSQLAASKGAYLPLRYWTVSLGL